MRLVQSIKAELASQPRCMWNVNSRVLWCLAAHQMNVVWIKSLSASLCRNTYLFISSKISSLLSSLVCSRPTNWQPALSHTGTRTSRSRNRGRLWLSWSCSSLDTFSFTGNFFFSGQKWTHFVLLQMFNPEWCECEWHTCLRFVCVHCLCSWSFFLRLICYTAFYPPFKVKCSGRTHDWFSLKFIFPPPRPHLVHQPPITHFHLSISCLILGFIFLFYISVVLSLHLTLLLCPVTLLIIASCVTANLMMMFSCV